MSDEENFSSRSKPYIIADIIRDRLVSYGWCERVERRRGSPEGAAGVWSAIGGHHNHQAVTKAPGPGFPQAIKERLFEARRPDPEDQRRQIRLAPYQTKGAKRYPTFSA